MNFRQLFSNKDSSNNEIQKPTFIEEKKKFFSEVITNMNDAYNLLETQKSIQFFLNLGNFILETLCYLIIISMLIAFFNIERIAPFDILHVILTNQTLKDSMGIVALSNLILGIRVLFIIMTILAFFWALSLRKIRKQNYVISKASEGLLTAQKNLKKIISE